MEVIKKSRLRHNPSRIQPRSIKHYILTVASLILLGIIVLWFAVEPTPHVAQSKKVPLRTLTKTRAYLEIVPIFLELYDNEKYYKLGHSWFDVKMYWLAKFSLNRVQSANNISNAKALYTLAKIERETGNLEKAYWIYYSVYQQYPTSYLADDALAMTGSILYIQNKIAKALDIYEKVLEEYPHSDIELWGSIGMCLRKFERNGDHYAYQGQIIPAERFQNLVILVSEKKKTYALLERFDYWEKYMRTHPSDDLGRQAYISSLLEKANFLQAQMEINKISQEYQPIVRFLKISKLFEFKKYEEVVNETSAWLSSFQHSAPSTLVPDCLIMRIKSILIQKNGPNINDELLESLSDLFALDRGAAYKIVNEAYNRISHDDLQRFVARNNRKPLAFLLLAQKSLESTDIKGTRQYLSRALMVMPSGNPDIIAKGKVLDRILDISDGHYDVLAPAEIEKELTQKFQKILKTIPDFNRNMNNVLTTYETQIDWFIKHRLQKAQNITDLFAPIENMPSYFQLTTQLFGHTFKNLAKLYYEKIPTDEKIRRLAEYRLYFLPRLSGKWPLVKGENEVGSYLSYESVAFLFLFFKKIGLSNETCRALFIHHLAFLAENGVFIIMSNQRFDPFSFSSTARCEVSFVTPYND